MGGGKQKSRMSQTPIDPTQVGRMGEMSEQMQQWAMDQYARGREIYDPLEEQQAEANIAQIQSDMRLIDPNERLMRTRMEEGTRDIEMGRELKDEARTQRLNELIASSPAMREYYQAATTESDEEIIDPEQYAREGGAEAAQQYSLAQGELMRNISRMGGDVRDLSTTGSLRRGSLERTKAVAGARNVGRRAGKTERRGQQRYLEASRFGRLADAVRMRSGGMAAATSLDNTAYAQGQMRLSDFKVGDPQDQAGQFMGGAIQASSEGMDLRTKTKGSGWNISI